MEQDQINLSELVGYEVQGMAYLCGGVNCNGRVADIIREETCIKYARTIDVTNSFESYADVYQYKGTLYLHEDWDSLFDMGRKFLELKTDTLKIFYIWGHAYEFDIIPERWEQFEEFCRVYSNTWFCIIKKILGIIVSFIAFKELFVLFLLLIPLIVYYTYSIMSRQGNQLT